MADLFLPSEPITLARCANPHARRFVSDFRTRSFTHYILPLCVAKEGKVTVPAMKSSLFRYFSFA